MKTVKEIAKELGVSPEKVTATIKYYDLPFRLSKRDVGFYKGKYVKVFDEAQEDFLKNVVKATIKKTKVSLKKEDDPNYWVSLDYDYVALKRAHGKNVHYEVYNVKGKYPEFVNVMSRKQVMKINKILI